MGSPSIEEKEAKLYTWQHEVESVHSMHKKLASGRSFSLSKAAPLFLSRSLQLPHSLSSKLPKRVKSKHLRHGDLLAHEITCKLAHSRLHWTHFLLGTHSLVEGFPPLEKQSLVLTSSYKLLHHGSHVFGLFFPPGSSLPY